MRARPRRAHRPTDRPTVSMSFLICELGRGDSLAMMLKAMIGDCGRRHAHSRRTRLVGVAAHLRSHNDAAQRIHAGHSACLRVQDAFGRRASESVGQRAGLSRNARAAVTRGKEPSRLWSHLAGRRQERDELLELSFGPVQEGVLKQQAQRARRQQIVPTQA